MKQVKNLSLLAIGGIIDFNNIAFQHLKRQKEAAFSFSNHLKKMIEQEEYCPKTVVNVNETGLFW